MRLGTNFPCPKTTTNKNKKKKNNKKERRKMENNLKRLSKVLKSKKSTKRGFG